MEMIEEHIPDTLNSVEISNKFNSQYKFFKMTEFSFMLQQINGGFFFLNDVSWLLVGNQFLMRFNIL